MMHSMSDKATIRSAVPGDAAAIAGIYAPYVTGTAISFEETPPTAEEIAHRMSGVPPLPWLVATVSGGIVGYAYAGPHRTRTAYRWSVDVSVYLASTHHRCGLGTALYRRLLPELSALGYVNAYAGVTLPNAASVGLHESLGFTPVGLYRDVGYKFGRWHDAGWWHLRLADPPHQPDEPRPWKSTAPLLSAEGH